MGLLCQSGDLWILLRSQPGSGCAEWVGFECVGVCYVLFLYFFPFLHPHQMILSVSTFGWIWFSNSSDHVETEQKEKILKIDKLTVSSGKKHLFRLYAVLFDSCHNALSCSESFPKSERRPRLGETSRSYARSSS